MRLWDPKAQTEVLILFPGSGNASRGQGPHKREMHAVARPEQSSAELGLRQAQGQARCNTAHIKWIQLVSNNIIPHVKNVPDSMHNSALCIVPPQAYKASVQQIRPKKNFAEGKKKESQKSRSTVLPLFR